MEPTDPHMDEVSTNRRDGDRDGSRVESADAGGGRDAQDAHVREGRNDAALRWLNSIENLEANGRPPGHGAGQEGGAGTRDNDARRVSALHDLPQRLSNLAEEVVHTVEDVAHTVAHVGHEIAHEVVEDIHIADEVVHKYATRAYVTKLVESEMFIGFIQLSIFISSVLLAATSPAYETPEWITGVDLFFTIVFTIEAILKIIDKTFRVYWADPWNKLDLVVVIESLASEVLRLAGFKMITEQTDALVALRVLRVMRPLRTIKRFPQLRVLTSALLQAMERLVDIGLLGMFSMMLLGVVGVLLWKGDFRYRCVPNHLMDQNSSWYAEHCKSSTQCQFNRLGTRKGEHSSDLWALGGEDLDFRYDAFAYPCRPADSSEKECKGADLSWGSGAWLVEQLSVSHPSDSCPESFTCVDMNQNPHWGKTSFDHLGYAVVNVFLVFTLENWANIVKITQAASNRYAWLYFVMLVIAGAFMLMQLLGAIILARMQIAIRSDKTLSAEFLDGDSSDEDNDESDDMHMDVQEFDLNAKKSNMDALGLGDDDPLESNVERERRLSKEAMKKRGGKTGSVADMSVKPNSRPSGLGSGVGSGWERKRRRSTLNVERGGKGLSDTGHSNSKVPGSGEQAPRKIAGDLEEGGGDVEMKQRHKQNQAVSMLSRQSTGAEGRPSGAARDSRAVTDQKRPDASRSHLTRWSTPTVLARSTTAITEHRHFKAFEQSRTYQWCCLPSYKWIVWLLHTPAIQNENFHHQVTHPDAYFTYFIMSCIVINIFTLSADSYGNAPQVNNVLELIDYIVVGLFALEMVLKILVMGVVPYMTHSRAYTFDMIITVGCLIAIDPNVTGGGFAVLRVFRVFRVLRMVRLGARMKSMVKMMTMIQNVLEPTGHVSILLTLFMIVFAILGVQLFAVKECAPCCTHPSMYEACGSDCVEGDCEKCEDCGVVEYRYNFQNFIFAMQTVFVMLTGESWPTIMFAALKGKSLWYCTYFIIWIVLGNYFLLNLVLATLLSRSQDVVAKKVTEIQAKKMLTIEELRLALRVRHVFKKWKRMALITKVSFFDHIARRLDVSRYFVHWARVAEGWKLSHANQLENGRTSRGSRGSFGERLTRGMATRLSMLAMPRRRSNVKQGVPQLPHHQLTIIAFMREDLTRWQLACRLIAEHEWLNGLVMAAIVGNTFLMILQDSDAMEKWIKNNVWVEWMLLALYSFEIGVWVAGFGAYTPKKKRAGGSDFFGWQPDSSKNMGFLDDKWRVLDLIMVIASFLYLVTSSLPFTRDHTIITGPCYVIRGFRPLRLLSRHAEARNLINTIGTSLSRIVDVFVVVMAFCFIASIMGQQLFKGTFFYCDGPTDHVTYSSEWYTGSDNATIAETMGWKNWWTDSNYPWSYPAHAPLKINRFTEKEDLALMEKEDVELIQNSTLFERGCREPRGWKNNDDFARRWTRDNSTEYPYSIVHHPYNFDDLGNSLISTLVVIMLEDWPAQALVAIDATGIERQPSPNNEIFIFGFFILVIVLGNFLFLQVFVAVLFEQFMMLRCWVGEKYVTPSQLRQLEFENRLIMDVGPYIYKPLPPNAISRLCRQITESKSFFIVETMVVVLNIGILLGSNSEQSDVFTRIQEWVGVFCGFVFVVEFFLMIIGHGWRVYFTDNENIINFIVTLVSAIDVYLTLSVGPLCGSEASILKILRCMRIMRVIKIVSTVPSLRVLLIALVRPLPTLLSLVLILVVAVVTFSNFCVVMFGGKFWGDEGYEGHPDFVTMWDSFESLMYFITGEEWTSSMIDAFHTRPKDCPKLMWNSLVVTFYCMFMVLTNLLVLNMFIMIVVSSYELVGDEQLGLNQQDILAFQKGWSQIDHEGTGFVYINKLSTLAKHLPASVIGIEEGKKPTLKQQIYYFSELNLDNFKTAQELYLDRFPRQHEVPRTDGMIHFHKVLLAVNRLSYKRKQNHTITLDTTSVKGGVAERHVMELKAAFILNRAVRRYRARKARKGRATFSEVVEQVMERKRSSIDRAVKLAAEHKKQAEEAARKQGKARKMGLSVTPTMKASASKWMSASLRQSSHGEKDRKSQSRELDIEDGTSPSNTDFFPTENPLRAASGDFSGANVTRSPANSAARSVSLDSRATQGLENQKADKMFSSSQNLLKAKRTLQKMGSVLSLGYEDNVVKRRMSSEAKPSSLDETVTNPLGNASHDAEDEHATVNAVFGSLSTLRSESWRDDNALTDERAAAESGPSGVDTRPRGDSAPNSTTSDRVDLGYYRSAGLAQTKNNPRHRPGRGPGSPLPSVRDIGEHQGGSSHKITRL